MQLQNPGGVRVAKTTIAAFLIARLAGAVIVLPAYDRPMTTTPWAKQGVHTPYYSYT